MADDPFDTSGRDDRTVFRPNPGGRRSPPYVPGPGAERSTPMPSSGYPAAGMPPQQGHPQSGRDPGPAAPQAPMARDDWGRIPGPDAIAARSTPAPVLLRREEMIVPHHNPIMRAAGPMLLLLGRLRIALMRASFAELMEHVADSVTAFEADLRNSGISDAQVSAAKYTLCATADDIVQNIPADDRHVWAQYSMLSRFFRERVGGVRFFELLDRSIADPLHNVELLELQHACLALGFQGRYRTQEGGGVALRDIQQRTWEVLKRVRRPPPEGLSPRWRGLDLRNRSGRVRIPIWVVGSIVAAILTALYLTYLMLLGAAAEVAADEVLGLHQPAQMSLLRKAPVPPPPPPPPPPAPPPPRPDVPLTQMQRIHRALGPEIASGAATATQVGTHVIIRVGSNFLFAVGSADVKPELRPLADRIAAMLDKEAGPILVIGHTDKTRINPGGRFKNNFELSLERARQVALLLRPGLRDPSRLRPEGRGEAEPVADNETDAGRARNRRVEIWIDRVD